MNIDQYGRVELSADDAFTSLYQGGALLENHFALDNENDILKFNQAVDTNADEILKVKSLEKLDCDIEEFDKQLQKNWFLPEEYKKLNIISWLLEKCKNDEERNRVNLEIELFVQHKMLGVLVYLKYLVDTMRSNNIVWGVGRGSSVASYCLYLIGVHKVNSIRYQLDIKEFLK